MKKQGIITIICLIIVFINNIQALGQVKACISIPSSYPYPIKSKTVWICKGTTMNLIGSNCLGNTSPTQESYSWINLSNNSSSSSAQNFFTADTGRWELTLTNLNDYSIHRDTIHLVYFNTPNFNINANAAVAGACLNQNVNLIINTPVGTSNYKWYLENDPTVKGNTSSLSFQSSQIPGGSAYYIATSNFNSVYPGGNYSCLLSDTILAFAKQTPAVTLPKDTSICQGQAINLQAVVSILPDNIPGDPKTHSFQWNGIGAFVNNTSTFLTSTSETNNKSYTVIAQNFLGCKAYDTILVKIKPGLSVNVGPPLSVCTGSTVQLDAVVSGSSGNINYSWTPSTGVSNAFIKSPSAVVNSNSTFTVFVQDQQGCTGTATKVVNISPGLNITITKDSTICQGSNIGLNAMVTGAASPSGYTYKWAPSTFLSNSTIYNPISTPTSNITYSVEISDQFGCKGTASTIVTIAPGIVLTPTFSDSTTAETDIVNISATATGGNGSLTYKWTPVSSVDVNTNLSMDVNPGIITTYILEVKDNIGCTATTQVLIDKLTVQLGSSDTLGLVGDSIKLNAFNPTQNGFDYKWMDSTGAIIGTGPFIWVKDQGAYEIFVYNPVTNSFVSDSIYVTFVREIKPIVEVPNVISPSMQNEDNKNLRVYGQGIVDENFIFQIYDQWGNLVYESLSFKEANESGWNGSLKNQGQILSLGVYTYTLRGEFKDGTSFSKTGTASLIK